MAGYSTREHKRIVANLLVHYFEYAWRKAGLNWDSDTYQEVRSIADNIFAEFTDLEARIEALEQASRPPAPKHNEPNKIRLVHYDKDAPEFIINEDHLFALVYIALTSIQVKKVAPGLFDSPEDLDELLNLAVDLRDWIGES